MKDDLSRLKELLASQRGGDLIHCTDEDYVTQEIARRASEAFANEFARIRQQSKERQRHTGK